MSELTLNDVLELLTVFDEAGLDITVDGGWGVDALLETQTRPHEDLDIALPEVQVPTLRRVLAGHGFVEIPRDDTWACNFVLQDRRGRTVDVHAYTLDEHGGNASGIAYEASHLTGEGRIGDRSVDCIEPETMVRFHTGYPLDDDDFHDVRRLCERFSIRLPDEYARFVELQPREVSREAVSPTRCPDVQAEIRPATEADAMAVTDVYIRSRETHVACAPLAHGHDDIGRWVREVLLPGGTVRVATIDGRVVGLVAASHDGGIDWIDHLYVAPERVGGGIGTALLRDALERLREPIRLWTFQANEGARRFYARHGFDEIEFTDGRDNEERCPDVLCELGRRTW